MGNDTGDSLYISSIDAGSWGSATINGDNTIRFSPDMCNDMPAGATRTETLNYTIMDSDMNSSSATVTITITGVNDAPTAEDDDNGTMGNHDTVITISTTSILSNDSDPDYDTLTVSISSATNGTATVNDVTVHGSDYHKVALNSQCQFYLCFPLLILYMLIINARISCVVGNVFSIIPFWIPQETLCFRQFSGS